MFGWIKERFWDQYKWSPDRSQVAYLLPFDTREYLGSRSRKETVRLVEGLAQRFGILKEGIRGVARHVIGKGLELRINSRELGWARDAKLQFEEYALTPGRFDIAGRRSLYDAQHIAVEQRILRGEFFAAAVENEYEPWQGEPAWQLYDSNEIETPDDIEEGAASRVFDGVKVDAKNRTLGYYTKTAEGSKLIPASAMTHWFQGMGINQLRGESDFAPVINRFVDWDDLVKLFTKHAKTHATLAVAVEKLAKVGGRGAFGSAIRRPGQATAGASPAASDAESTRALEKAFPGMISYLGEGGKVQMLNSSSPNEALAKFITDVLAPDVFAALGIPPEFFWQVTRAGGATQRFVLSRADLVFQILADGLVYRWLNAVAFRFISHRIRIGKLDKPKDENWASKMSWQTPAKLSIDRGDKQLEIEQLANGTITMQKVHGRQGDDDTEETRQWIREWLNFDVIAVEEGATPEQLALLRSRWRAPKPGTLFGPTGEPIESGKPAADDKAADEDKAA